MAINGCKISPKHRYDDDEYTKCGTCETRCEKAIKCVKCQAISGVFYSRKYDFFLCGKCYNDLETGKG